MHVSAHMTAVFQIEFQISGYSQLQREAGNLTTHIVIKTLIIRGVYADLIYLSPRFNSG